MNPEPDLARRRFDQPSTPAPGEEAAAAYLTACAESAAAGPRPDIIREHSLLTVALAFVAGFFLGRLVIRR